ncbi:threonine/serine exporter family protein [Nocardia sp. NPDC058480]|uniref:threonine/serine exporter family protein n=1 Tax=unclassified Nocardia TaxID=2637762 RepID=UPI00364D8FA0
MLADDRRLGELGALLLDAGMSVTDVRASMESVSGAALGEHPLEFAALPDMVIVSDRDSGAATVVRSHGGALTFQQAAQANQLVRRATTTPVARGELLDRIDDIRRSQSPPTTWNWALGSALIAGGLALTFRSPWWSILAAIVIGAVVGLVASMLRGENAVAVAPFVAAFLSTVSIGVTASVLGLGPVPLFAVCAPIAILVPGVVITNALLELTATDIVTGASRLVYGLMMLGFMYAGIVAGAAATGLHIDQGSATLIGEIATVTGGSGWHALPGLPLTWIGVALLSIGIGLAFGSGMRLTAFSVVMMSATYSLLIAVTPLVGNVVATGITAAALLVIARILERFTDVPTAVSYQPAWLLLIPGTVGLAALASLNTASAQSICATFVSLCLGTKAGALIADLLTPQRHHRNHAREEKP